VDELKQSYAPELSPLGSRKWIGRLVIAVLLAVAIWGFVVSLTTDVVIPALAQVMPADPQSPLYLGKGELNIAALFTSFLELCFAAIAALLVNSWACRVPRPARRKAARVAPAAAATPVSRKAAAKPPSPTPPPAPVAPQPSSVLASQVSQKQQTPQSQPTPAASAEAKPPKPKKVYYNLVGEQIESDEE
jgi:hypothetical protein